MKKLFTLMLLLMLCITGRTQNADKLYAEGKSLYDAKRYTEAVAKLRPAAEKGHKKAQYRLGRCYDKGLGVEENNETAFQWYAKAAAQDHTKSQYQLGRCYMKGKGTEKNQKKAVEYFMKAAKKDHAEAQLALGKAYMKGKGVEADPKKAKSWISKAVKHPDDGKALLEELRKEAAAGDADAKAILDLIGKKQ